MNKLFADNEKSSFPYWYAHWKAYNKVAREWGVWKFRYLFHDIEKPFLRLFMPYEKVRKWHKLHNRHHEEYPDKTKIDWMGLIIDWESSQYTKLSQPMNCWSYANYMIEQKPEIADLIKINVLPVLKAMGKDKPYNRNNKD